MDLAKIVLFVYNRPWHTRKCLVSLARNDLANASELFIYADGPKENAKEEQLQKIKEVRRIIKEKKWCGKVEIIEREKNMGLANSVISGVTEIVNKYGEIIVMEDDLIVSTGFLKFMNEALCFYSDKKKVMHVSGYMFPIRANLPETFFYNSTSCWGWATWARAWKIFNSNSEVLLQKLKDSNRMKEFTLSDSNGHDKILYGLVSGKVDSWAIRWNTSVFLQKGLCLHPNKSLVRNIGHDDDGVNCKYGWWSEIYLKQELADFIQINSIPLEESLEAREAVKKFNKTMGNPLLFARLKEKVKSMFTI